MFEECETGLDVDREINRELIRLNIRNPRTFFFIDAATYFYDESINCEDKEYKNRLLMASLIYFEASNKLQKLFDNKTNKNDGD